jgi:Quercetinase C-terminal cupin domain
MITLRKSEERGHVNHGWLHVAEGEIGLNRLTLKSGDAAAFSDEKEISFTVKSPAQILHFDLN